MFSEGEEELRRFALVVERAIHASEEIDLRPQTPVDLIVGIRLRKIFERHFKKRAGLGREVRQGSSAKPNSPFIRFARATLREFGINQRNGQPYSLEAIYRAFRVGRSRK